MHLVYGQDLTKQSGKYSGWNIQVKKYSLKFWYSHHTFLHSISAGVLIAICIGICSYFIIYRHNKKSFNGLISSLVRQKLIFIGFLARFIIHLFWDMPTPSSVWGGVNLFWPSKTYIGGNGDLWWWNNYDIFIIVIMIILINLLLGLAQYWMKIDTKKLTTTVFILGLTLIIIQIKSTTLC